MWSLKTLSNPLSTLLDPLTESLDTQSPGGRLIFHIFGAIAEFERDLIRARTQAGLAAARKRGRMGGRQKALNPTQIAHLQRLVATGEVSVGEACKTFGISRASYYRYLEDNTNE